MSKTSGPDHWKCDRCTFVGAQVDPDETLPYRWLSLGVLVGTPQIAGEMRDRRIHLCRKCGEDFLFGQIQGGPDEIERLRSIWKRADQ